MCVCQCLCVSVCVPHRRTQALDAVAEVQPLPGRFFFLRQHSIVQTAKAIKVLKTVISVAAIKSVVTPTTTTSAPTTAGPGGSTGTSPALGI